MRLREFKQPRQRIDEVVVAGIPLAAYIYGLLIAGGAMIAGDPRTQKVIQKKVDQWMDSNPDQELYAKQIKQGQDAGALPKDPSKVGDVAFPVASALSKAWDWLTGGSTTGNKPAQPDQYVKDKNGLLRRKETAQQIQKQIGDVIASNSTTFSSQEEARKALPSLKDGTRVTINGKTYTVSDSAAVSGTSQVGKGFTPYKDMGTVTAPKVSPQVQSPADVDAGAGLTVSMPQDKADDGPSWLDRVGDAVGGVFNTVAGAVGGLFGSEDDVKTNIPPARSPDLPDMSNRAKSQGGGTADQAKSQPVAGAPPKTVGDKAPPIAGLPPVSGVKGKEGTATDAGTQAGTQAGTGAEAGSGADTVTGTQTGTGADTVTGTQAGSKAGSKADAVPSTTTQTIATTTTGKPVTPPPIVTPMSPVKTRPYDPKVDKDIIYKGKVAPKRVLDLDVKDTGADYYKKELERITKKIG